MIRWTLVIGQRTQLGDDVTLRQRNPLHNLQLLPLQEDIVQDAIEASHVVSECDVCVSTFKLHSRWLLYIHVTNEVVSSTY